MAAAARATPLYSELRERIEGRGRITFAEYMESCLYDPEYGYYMQPQQERLRDYYTSADVTPVFGRLLARQFHDMWQQLGQPSAYWLVEAGAGTGRLAKHILDWCAGGPGEFYEALRYVTVERSRARRRAQEEILRGHISSGKLSIQEELPEEIFSGCVFSNEFFDALPVHRVRQGGDGLREIYVNSRRGALSESLGPLSTPQIAAYFEEQGVALEEGQQAEAGLAACRSMEDAGRRLGRGFFLTIDYGHEAAELYNERHMRGTILAYHRHRASEDYYRAPGKQDLTAHVNFTALDLAGRRAGLERLGLTSQGNFLLALARRSEFADLQPEGSSEAEQARLRLLFKNLIHPEGMGETFRVLVQQKGAPGARLAGLEPL